MLKNEIIDFEDLSFSIDYETGYIETLVKEHGNYYRYTEYNANNRMRWINKHWLEYPENFKNILPILLEKINKENHLLKEILQACIDNNMIFHESSNEDTLQFYQLNIYPKIKDHLYLIEHYKSMYPFVFLMDKENISKDCLNPENLFENTCVKSLFKNKESLMEFYQKTTYDNTLNYLKLVISFINELEKFILFHNLTKKIKFPLKIEEILGLLDTYHQTYAFGDMFFDLENLMLFKVIKIRNNIIPNESTVKIAELIKDNLNNQDKACFKLNTLLMCLIIPFIQDEHLDEIMKKLLKNSYKNDDFDMLEFSAIQTLEGWKDEKIINLVTSEHQLI